MKRMHTASALFLMALLLGASLAGCGAAAPTSEPLPTAEATAAQPASAQEFFQVGNQHARVGEFEEAISAYQAALELEPDHVSAMTNLGVAYYNNGQLDEAVSEYLKALAVSPDDEAIHSNLAAAYVQQGKLEEALASYTRALEIEPTLSQAYFGLGVVYMQMEQTEDAIQAFENFQKYDNGEDSVATSQAEQYLNQLRGQ
ncbi:MAG TPA: tetratricopeptide repeat protein [Anaerolineae bacterium]|nr:tetratricopeptide repeat protein [Anaerolineae bacterium]